MDTILRRELAEGLGFLQQLQYSLGFEAGAVRLFHLPILPNPGLLTVQILGSTIMLSYATASDLERELGAGTAALRR